MNRHVETKVDPTDPDDRHPGRVPSDLVVRMGHTEFVLRQRYELLSIANDVFAGLLFLIGSVLFFHVSTTYVGTWLFVIGSVSMLIRPTIRLMRRVHIGRARAASGLGHESSMDF